MKSVISAVCILAVIAVSLFGTVCASAATVIKISDVKGLRYLADPRYSGSSFALAQTIIITDADYASGGALYGYWTPAGSESAPFSGTLDGCGYTIYNLKISTKSDETGSAGLFGVLTGTVKNLTLEAITINTDTKATSAFRSAGSIAGTLRGGSISNCRASGSITVEQSYATTGNACVIAVGGIAGTVSSGSVENCYSDVSLKAYCGASGGDSYSGGICGIAEDSATVKKCSSVGEVCGVSNGTKGTTFAGGIAGLADSSEISLCSASGKVTATAAADSYGGGVCGRAILSDISNVIARGNVIVNGAASVKLCGGLIGKSALSSLKCGVFTASLTGSTKDGAIAQLSDAYNTATSVYTSQSTTVSGAVKLSASALKSKSSYSGFDFSSVWSMGSACAELSGLPTASSGTPTSSIGTISGSVLKVGTGKTVGTLIASITNGRAVVTKNSKILSDTDKLTTGCNVKVYSLGVCVLNVTLAVNGDTNGDGESNISDLIQIKRVLLKKRTFTAVEQKAADVNNSGAVDIADFIRVKGVILKKYSLN